MRIHFTLPLFALAVACGDVSRLEVDLIFPDSTTQSATQQLLVVSRTPKTDGTSCDALWRRDPSNLGEYVSLIGYPNRNALVAAPLAPDDYTVLVYALPQPVTTLCKKDEQCAGTTPAMSCRPLEGGQSACLPAGTTLSAIAGGCSGGIVTQDLVTAMTVTLEKAPAGH